MYIQPTGRPAPVLHTAHKKNTQNSTDSNEMIEIGKKYEAGESEHPTSRQEPSRTASQEEFEDKTSPTFRQTNQQLPTKNTKILKQTKISFTNINTEVAEHHKQAKHPPSGKEMLQSQRVTSNKKGKMRKSTNK